MKVVQRGIMKILPGKMSEAQALMEKHMAITTRLGMDPSRMRSYRYMTGGEIMHTMIFEYDWDSLLEFAEFFEKNMQDREMQELMMKWPSVVEHHSMEILTPMP
jgi:hypothetical protein